MKILVTGGSGFIGTQLMKKLVNIDCDVINYDKNNSIEYPEKTIIGDIIDLDEIKNATKNIDLVIHLAAEHSDNVSPTSLYYEVNVIGTKNVISACEYNRINKIIYTSTVALYGLNNSKTSEDSTLNPFNDYGKSKLEAEKLLISWQKRSINRSLSIIRPTAVFGINNRGNVYNLINQIASGKFISIGKCENKKSIAYVENLVDFIIFSFNDFGLKVTNYADKPDLTMQELVDLIYKNLGYEKGRYFIPYSMALIGGYIFDIISYLIRRKFKISAIRVKKFCADSIINTEKLENLEFNPLVKLDIALKDVIDCEFGNKLVYNKWK